MSATPRVVIAQDSLAARGGAERVTLSLARAFPGSVIVTTVYEPSQTYEEFRDHWVVTTPLQQVAAARRDPRVFMPLLPAAIAATPLPPADVMIAQTTGWAHGFRGPARSVLYMHTPARWIYHAEDFLVGSSPAVRLATRLSGPSLRQWDQKHVRRADQVVAGNTKARSRIQQAYGLDADVVFPPVTLDASGSQEACPGIRPGFFLVVSRPRGYKNVDVVVEAARRSPGVRLVVVGDAEQSGSPEDQVYRAGRVSDAQLRWLYAHAEALVTVSREDFGLTPLEANTFGTPAVVLRAGGFLDTVIEGVNGTFVDEAAPDAVAAALVSHRSPAPDRVREHARLFSEQAFMREWQERVDVLMDAEPVAQVR